MKIYVCDDRDPELICSALETARDRGANIPLPDSVFTDPSLLGTGTGRRNLIEAIGGLNDAAKSAIVEGKIESTLFDGADLVLLDYGLTALEWGKGGPRLTADHIAGYIRAFSDCAYVVSLNRLADVDFDLKYLIGDFETKSDLALNTPHLEQPGLWSGLPAQGEFCPWYWPRLNLAANRRRAQISALESRLGVPLLEVLGIPEAVTPHLSNQAVAFLSPQAEDPAAGAPASRLDVRRTTAWHHFRSSNRTLVKNDREDLVRSFGGDLSSEDIPASPELRRIVARVVAAELEFWFRRDVMGSQRLLVDAPHLQVRYPFRRSATDTVAAWDATAQEFEAAPYGLDQALFSAIPQEAFYLQSPWIDRPAFWLPLIERNNNVSDLVESYERNTNLVFCEDTRRFRQRNESFRFQTEIGKGIDVRYVEVEGAPYSPRTLFAR